MRPPHCAGEIEVERVDIAEQQAASMRPPHCAGEIMLAHEKLAKEKALQ